jgi:hypothetical protein
MDNVCTIILKYNKSLEEKDDGLQNNRRDENLLIVFHFVTVTK